MPLHCQGVDSRRYMGRAQKKRPGRREPVRGIGIDHDGLEMPAGPIYIYFLAAQGFLAAHGFLAAQGLHGFNFFWGCPR